MGTHAVAFLLLKKFRSGTNLVTLVQEVEDLVKYLELRKRGCGFTGNVKGVVLHAVSYCVEFKLNVKIVFHD